MMKRLIILTMLYLSAGSAYGSETWDCKTPIFGEEVLVTAIIHDSKTTGQIEVAGVTHSTSYGVEGFDRRWIFDSNDSGYDYAFVISPDGVGYYYDFTMAKPGEITQPRNVYHCTQQ